MISCHFSRPWSDFVCNKYCVKRHCRVHESALLLSSFTVWQVRGAGRGGGAITNFLFWQLRLPLFATGWVNARVHSKPRILPNRFLCDFVFPKCIVLACRLVAKHGRLVFLRACVLHAYTTKVRIRFLCFVEYVFDASV